MSRDVTQLLIDWSDGDREALDHLMPLVYDRLHRLAERTLRRERPGHTLQPTALIHETYLQLIDQKRVKWQNRTHFFAVAARLMRRVVMLHARSQRAAKRGGGALKITFDEALALPDETTADLIAVDEALESLETVDPRLARIVELRFFGGLTTREAAAVLDVSPTTVKRDWRTARAWLADRLGAGANPAPGA